MEYSPHFGSSHNKTHEMVVKTAKKRPAGALFSYPLIRQAGRAVGHMDHAAADEPRPLQAALHRHIGLVGVRPQVGQAMMLTPSLRSPAAFRMSFAVSTSCTGSAVSDTRIVSPMP